MNSMTMKTEKPKFEKGLILLCNKCKPRLAKRNLDAQQFEYVLRKHEDS